MRNTDPSVPSTLCIPTYIYWVVGILAHVIDLRIHKYIGSLDPGCSMQDALQEPTDSHLAYRRQFLAAYHQH